MSTLIQLLLMQWKEVHFTESQTGWDWKGSQWIIWNNFTPKEALSQSTQHRIVCRQLWNISREGHSTSSLDNLSRHSKDHLPHVQVEFPMHQFLPIDPRLPASNSQLENFKMRFFFFSFSFPRGISWSIIILWWWHILQNYSAFNCLPTTLVSTKTTISKISKHYSIWVQI